MLAVRENLRFAPIEPQTLMMHPLDLLRAEKIVLTNCPPDRRIHGAAPSSTSFLRSLVYVDQVLLASTRPTGPFGQHRSAYTRST